MRTKDVFPRTLQYLITISEYGSFTRAADALHVSQPTLSQQIKQLEDSLATALLDRSGRTIRLTDAGEIYVHHARRAWRELDTGTRAIHDVQNLTRGSLRLGWTPITDHLTCSLLEKFNQSYSGIVLSTLELPQEEIEHAILEDRIDVGIAFTKPTNTDSSYGEIETYTLFEESLHFAVGDSHPRANQKIRMNLMEFGSESLVLLNTQFALRRHIDQYCYEHNINPHISIETNSLGVIIEMTRMGTLGTILPETIIRMQNGINSIDVTPDLPHHTVSLIWHKTGYKSPACLAFLEIASDWSARLLQEAHSKTNKIKSLPKRKNIELEIS